MVYRNDISPGRPYSASFSSFILKIPFLASVLKIILFFLLYFSKSGKKRENLKTA
jgi:hypothetical protein